MKIAYASDFHTELGQRPIPLLERVDVCILAGDIGKGAQAAAYAASYATMADHVVFVFGNHDSWGSRIDKAHRQARELTADLPNVHFLENDTVEINGVKLIGATAWTDFIYGSDTQSLNMLRARDAMNDYKKITWKSPSGNFSKLRPENVLQMNHTSADYIFGELEKHGGENCVVVTHHAPCHLSIAERFLGDNLNCCYVNQWGDRISYLGPKLWFHGHIHDPSDYEIGATRVLANPIGYPGEYPDSGFKYAEI